MTDLFTNAAAIMARPFGPKAEMKRSVIGSVRGGQKAPQAHGVNPCDPGGPGM